MSVINVVCPHCMQVNRVPRRESYSKANCGKCKKSLLENKVIETDSSGFKYVIDNSTLPIVVDFWAPWCGPCRMMAPAFKDASLAVPLKAQFLKINTEDNPQLAGEFQIRSIPTIVVIVNGREVNRVSGALSKDKILHLISGLI